MKFTGLALALILASLPLLAEPVGSSGQRGTPHITGQYLESRNADVYTGPCIANSEVGQVGQNAVMAWHVDHGVWNNVPLDNLSVIAVVRASSTLGDPYSNPLPAKARIVVDAKATPEQRSALISFAQHQAGMLLSTIVAVEALPIQLEIGHHHGMVELQAGNEIRLATRAINENDTLCHNEEVYYPPLAANLTHSMPAVTTENKYNGKDISWDEAGRRGAFVGIFAA